MPSGSMRYSQRRYVGGSPAISQVFSRALEWASGCVERLNGTWTLDSFRFGDGLARGILSDIIADERLPEKLIEPSVGAHQVSYEDSGEFTVP